MQAVSANPAVAMPAVSQLADRKLFTTADQIYEAVASKQLAAGTSPDYERLSASPLAGKPSAVKQLFPAPQDSLPTASQQLSQLAAGKSVGQLGQQLPEQLELRLAPPVQSLFHEQAKSIVAIQVSDTLSP